MKLRGKTLVIISATLIGMVGLLYAAASAIFLKTITKAEEQSNRQTVQGVLNVLAQTYEDFNARFADWSAWDDTYAFIENRNSSYLESNLVPGTLQSLRVNLVLFVDTAGKLVYGTSFDATSGKLMPISNVVRQRLVLGDRLLQHPAPSSRLTGLWVLPEGPMLITSQPIVTSEGSGSIRGTLIMGRALDSLEVERLSRITHLPLTIYRINDAALPPDFQAARSTLSQETPLTFFPLRGQSMAGYTLLNDIYGQPALLLRVEIPREIYQQGQTSLNYLVVAVVLTGLIFGGVTLLLLERLVLSRLTQFSSDVRQIGQSGDFSMRVQSVSGADELPLLAKDVNRMLEALEQSQAEITALNQQMLAQMHQEKTDLEILLEANTEHFDTIEFELEQQVEAERRQKEEQFQLITEATPVAILIAEIADGQILYANESAGLIFGISPSALLNYRAPDFYNDPAECQQIMPLLAEGQPFQGEVHFKRVDGTLFWALLSLRPFMFQGKRTILTALSDITDRKQAEEALRLAEENYRSIFENALDGIYQVAPTGQYLRVNSAMAQILGYKSPEHMIETVVDASNEYVDEIDRDTFNQLMLTNQGEITGYERQMYRRDGSIIWVSESARSVRDERGNLLYHEGIIEDITQRKQMEAMLRQQVQQLQIEIDQTKRERQVAEITQTDYFQKLLEEADALRYSED